MTNNVSIIETIIKFREMGSTKVSQQVQTMKNNLGQLDKTVVTTTRTFENGTKKVHKAVTDHNAATKAAIQMEKERIQVLDNLKMRLMGVGFGLLFTAMGISMVANSAMRSLMNTFLLASGETSAYAQQINGLAGMWEFLKFNMMDAFASSEFFTWMIDSIISAIDWFTSLDDSVQTFIVAGLILTVALTAISMALGTVVLGLVAIIDLIPMLGLTAFGLAFGGVVTWAIILVAMIWIAIQYFKKLFSKEFIDNASALELAIAAVGGAIIAMATGAALVNLIAKVRALAAAWTATAAATVVSNLALILGALALAAIIYWIILAIKYTDSWQDAIISLALSAGIAVIDIVNGVLGTVANMITWVINQILKLKAMAFGTEYEPVTIDWRDVAKEQSVARNILQTQLDVILAKKINREEDEKDLALEQQAREMLAKEKEQRNAGTTPSPATPTTVNLNQNLSYSGDGTPESVNNFMNALQNQNTDLLKQLEKIQLLNGGTPSTN